MVLFIFVALLTDYSDDQLIVRVFAMRFLDVSRKTGKHDYVLCQCRIENLAFVPRDRAFHAR